MIDTRTYKELLAACLHLHAEKLMESSRSHFEPNGPQARAQAIKAKELLDWCRTEMTEANIDRDFTTQKISKGEITLAIEFAEDVVEKLSPLITEELERAFGPLEEITLQRNAVQSDLPVEFDEAFRRKAGYNMALFYLRLALRSL